ncbi:hypothetical protein [Rhodopseudomonas sp.]|uniref:hypothetical protein n=1 Tax=Rhodopseudomonas sp. TaxID=1078 RepID=UPI003B3B9032
MSKLPSAQEIARGEIAVMVEIFERERDASAAWRAFSLARKYGCELPESINSEIDRFAEAVGSIAERAHQGDRKATIDNETVGKIWKNHKNRDSGGATFRARRDYDIAIAVERLRRNGYSATHAVTVICKQHGVSKTTVQDAMQLHADVRYMGTDELGAL